MGDNRSSWEVGIGSVQWTEDDVDAKRTDLEDESAWAVEERVRKEVAAMLHGNVQSRLSACNVWLSMAEQLLGDLRFDMTHLAPEMTAQSILAALSLLHKVRGEVEQLRKTEVQRAVQQLYPTLIHIGLRPALEALESVPKEIAFVSDVDDSARAALEWVFSDEFVHWDRPTNEENVLQVRLEAYRLVEAAVRAAQAASMVYAAPANFSEQKAKAASALAVRIHLDVVEDELHVRVSAQCDAAARMCNESLAFVARSLPRQRFKEAGGRLSVLSDVNERLHVKAMLPVV